LPFSISSSCCSMLASSCLHQAMKRSGADMGSPAFPPQRKTRGAAPQFRPSPDGARMISKRSPAEASAAPIVPGGSTNWSGVLAGSESLSLLRLAGVASAKTIAKTATTRSMDSQMPIPCRGSSIRLIGHRKASCRARLRHD
jgi:hypothetical protein